MNPPTPRSLGVRYVYMRIERHQNGVGTEFAGSDSVADANKPAGGLSPAQTSRGADHMAGQGLLQSVRVIESSMLGPAELGSLLADLGADVIKVEPPQGDYGRQMTWPIVKAGDGNGENSLLSLHVNRGKKSIAIDLRKPEGVEVYLDLVKGADVVIEAMRPGGTGQARHAVRKDARGQPAHRLLHDLRLWRDRSVPRHAEPRHRLRHVGRPGAARQGRVGFRRDGRARQHRHPRRPRVRRTGHPRRGTRGALDGQGLLSRGRAE